MTTSFANTSIRLGALLTILSLVAQHSTAHAAEPLGRLFFTPEKRQALDHQRQQNIQQKPQEEPEDRTLTINGFVTRSSGKRTVWVNGVARNENETASGISIKAGKDTPGEVLVEDNAKRNRTQVGNSINLDTGKSADLLNGGHILVRRGK